jgi:putative heme-binding domain-containing protein
VWRLTPKGAEGAFAARAAATALPDSDRLMAVTALGFTPTREAATAMLDLAEKGTGAVKNHAMWWLLNYKDIRWNEFGVDAALKQRGLFNPDTAIVTPSVVPEPEPSKLTVAQITALKGDVAKGADKAQACLLCHKIGDKGNEYGPSLTGFAKAQTADVVINAIINPSAEIAHGFDGVELNLRDGGKLHGILLSSGDPLIVQSMGGQTQIIPGSKTRGGRPQQLGRSLMLSAEQLGLSAQDVSDIAAYLKTQ